MPDDPMRSRLVAGHRLSTIRTSTSWTSGPLSRTRASQSLTACTPSMSLPSELLMRLWITSPPPPSVTIMAAEAFFRLPTIALPHTVGLEPEDMRTWQPSLREMRFCTMQPRPPLCTYTPAGSPLPWILLPLTMGFAPLPISMPVMLRAMSLSTSSGVHLWVRAMPADRPSCTKFLRITIPLAVDDTPIPIPKTCCTSFSSMTAVALSSTLIPAPLQSAIRHLRRNRLAPVPTACTHAVSTCAASSDILACSTQSSSSNDPPLITVTQALVPSVAWSVRLRIEARADTISTSRPTVRMITSLSSAGGGDALLRPALCFSDALGPPRMWTSFVISFDSSYTPGRITIRAPGCADQIASLRLRYGPFFASTTKTSKSSKLTGAAISCSATSSRSDAFRT
mmetsp:Transcript_23624/g.38837  ORF Transcript_23624/g.38837 Transcript_23624/m.38837 type:complete len:397 (+) Transcript_23624:1185-2375(+)